MKAFKFVMPMVTAAGLWAYAQPPSIDLPGAVPGTLIQPVQFVKQKEMFLFVNDYLLGEPMNIPGWDMSTSQAPNQKMMMASFGVRTKPKDKNSEKNFFYVGAGVGRSGVWEITAPGTNFAFVNGVPLKGLTIKGYGGNVVVGKQQQPKGSCDSAEAYRDILLSKILMEFGIDTYIGSFTLERPDGKANFVRLSRTSLRMNDIIYRSGAELRAVVDHLTNVLIDEAGKKMSPEEFATWLTVKTATTLAGKEYIQLKHGSQTQDNLGIAELVDHGEGEYDPTKYSKKQSKEQVDTFRTFLQEAVEKIESEYQFNIDFAATFKEAFDQRYNAMEQADANRVLIDVASEAELKKIGLTDDTIKKIEAVQKNEVFGLLTIDDVLRVDVTAEQAEILKQKTSTSFMQYDNGKFLPRAIVNEFGSDGLREIIISSLNKADAKKVDYDSAKMTKIIREQADEFLKLNGKGAAIGFADQYWSYGTHAGKNIARQIIKMIKQGSPALKTRTLVKSCRGVI